MGKVNRKGKDQKYDNELGIGKTHRKEPEKQRANKRQRAKQQALTRRLKREISDNQKKDKESWQGIRKNTEKRERNLKDFLKE